MRLSRMRPTFMAFPAVLGAILGCSLATSSTAENGARYRGPDDVQLAFELAAGSDPVAA